VRLRMRGTMPPLLHMARIQTTSLGRVCRIFLLSAEVPVNGLLKSQIDTLKFVFKTDILMVYASFCRSTIQPFPCQTQYNCPLNKSMFILSGLIQGLSTITTLQLYCTASLHTPDIREYCSCSVQDNDKRNVLYIYSVKNVHDTKNCYDICNLSVEFYTTLLTK